jgi:uncharacterized phiE125 gp8 family phage protein
MPVQPVKNQDRYSVKSASQLSDLTPVVTLTEAKSWVGLPDAGTAHDTTLTMLIESATNHVEKATKLALIERQVDYARDGWPYGWDQANVETVIKLPTAPVSAVTINYSDQAGAPVAVDPADLSLEGDAGGQFVRLLGDLVEPTPGSIVLAMTAGFGSLASDVPAALRHCVLQLVFEWFDFRAGKATGGPQIVPKNVHDVLKSWALGDDFLNLANG